MTRPAIGGRGCTLLTTATVSRIADNTAPVAIVLLVIARTHDARLAGLLVAAFTVPALVAGPVLGAYLDRLRRRRLLFTASQSLLALDLAAVLTLAGRVPGWLLAVLALAAGATSPVMTSGYSSLVPLVVAPAALGRANALDSASYGLAGIAGPAVIAALAGAFGVTAGFSALVAIAALGVPLLLIAPMPAAKGSIANHGTANHGTAQHGPGRTVPLTTGRRAARPPPRRPRSRCGPRSPTGSGCCAGRGSSSG